LRDRSSITSIASNQNSKIVIRQSPKARKRLDMVIDRHPSDAVALLRRWLQEGKI